MVNLFHATSRRISWQAQNGVILTRNRRRIYPLSVSLWAEKYCWIEARRYRVFLHGQGISLSVFFYSLALVFGS